MRNQTDLPKAGAWTRNWWVWPALIAACSQATGAPQVAPANVITRPSGVTGFASFVRAVDGKGIPVKPSVGGAVAVPMGFLKQHGHLFGVDDATTQLVLERAEQDAIGFTSTSYRQVHKGVTVFSGILRVHQDRRGRVTAANGDFYPIDPGLSVEASIDAATALSHAQTELGVSDATVEHSELVVVDPGWYGDPSIGEHLAYHIVLSQPANALRETVFVDAHTGEVIDHWSMLCRFKNRSIHDPTLAGDCCFAHDSTGCEDYDCEVAVCQRSSRCCDEEWDRYCAARAGYVCEELCLPGPLSRGEGEAPTGDADTDFAYDYFGDTYDYYLRGFGRDGLDGFGLEMIATVSSPVPGCPNAFWSGARRQMVFCPGTVADDVVGHELTHGVTEFTANLIYKNQSGQLNESFSDVFGELIDLFNGDAGFVGTPDERSWPGHPSGPGLDEPNAPRSTCSRRSDGFPDGVRWLIAEDALAFEQVIRDMWDPTCLDDPDRANSPLQTCSVLDAGGVHSGSGVPNHGFVLATDGGTFNGETIRGIGPIKTGAVWYRALTTYLTISSDFEEAYTALNQAASDLIGSYPLDPRSGAPSANVFTADDASQIDIALRAVEMDTPGLCGWTTHVLNSDPPFPCAGANVVYADDFESGVGDWRVSNSGPPTPYDWIQAGELPFDRAGSAWFCSDSKQAACNGQDESALHSLFSPLIELPEDASYPYLAFTHYVETEPGYDGGNLSISVNGTAWQHVPASAFEFNSYNSIMLSLVHSHNTSPLAEQVGWTGAGGRWGKSAVRLSDLVQGGDTLEVRFDFGKDACSGFAGWYVDDFSVYTCGDCNLNDRPDHRDFRYTAHLGPHPVVGSQQRNLFQIAQLPPAEGDVKVSIMAIADLSSAGENFSVLFNEVEVGRAFELGGSDCPMTPNDASIVIPAAVFNDIVLESDGGIDSYASRELRIELVPTGQVNADLCGPTGFLTVFIEYDLNSEDADGNGVLDVCENCRVSEPAAPESVPVAKARYLSFAPGNSGRRTALQVIPIEMPEPFASLQGTEFWVGEPERISDHPARTDTTPPTSLGARLSCEPVFSRWGDGEMIYVSDAAIVPGALYEVRAIDLACGRNDSAMYSAPLSVATGIWGDVTAVCSTPPCGLPDGSIDIIDVTAIMNAFRYLAGAPSKPLADLAPRIPNRTVDILDVVSALDAMRSMPYPYTGRGPCP